MVDRNTILVGGAVAVGAWLLSQGGTEEPMGTSGQTTTTTPDIPADPVGSLAEGFQSFASDITSSPQVEAVGDIASETESAVSTLGLDDDLPGADTVTDTAAAVAGKGNLNAGVEAVTTVTDAVTGQSEDTATQKTTSEVQDTVTQQWSDDGIIDSDGGGTTTGTEDPVFSGSTSDDVTVETDDSGSLTGIDISDAY
jgi:hypothetical protein